MLRGRSRAGILGWRPLWASLRDSGVHYGLLTASRPVIAWNVIAVLINFLSVRHTRTLYAMKGLDAHDPKRSNPLAGEGDVVGQIGFMHQIYGIAA